MAFHDRIVFGTKQRLNCLAGSRASQLMFVSRFQLALLELSGLAEITLSFRFLVEEKDVKISCGLSKIN